MLWLLVVWISYINIFFRSNFVKNSFQLPCVHSFINSCLWCICSLLCWVIWFIYASLCCCYLWRPHLLLDSRTVQIILGHCNMQLSLLLLTRFTIFQPQITGVKLFFHFLIVDLSLVYIRTVIKCVFFNRWAIF